VAVGPDAGRTFVGDAASVSPVIVGGRVRPGKVVAKVDWGDGTPVERLDVQVMGIVFSSGPQAGTSHPQLSLTQSHRYAEPGTYIATINYRRGGRRIFRDYQTFDISQNSPGGFTLEGQPGGLLDTDLGTFPSLGFPVTEGTIDWGDGSDPLAGVFQTLDDGSVAVRGSHVYAAPGTYRVVTYVRFAYTNTSPVVPHPVLHNTAVISSGSDDGVP
jgi:hypothetical protein